MKRITLAFKNDPQHTKPRVFKVEFDGPSHLLVSTEYHKGAASRMTLVMQPDGSYRNEHGCEFIKIKADRRPKPYAIDCREEGRGPANITKFATIGEVRDYVKARWQGAEYIDSPTSFHSDYARFTLKNCTLADLGKRGGEPGSDEYYDWQWHTDATKGATDVPKL